MHLCSVHNGVNGMVWWLFFKTSRTKCAHLNPPSYCYRYIGEGCVSDFFNEKMRYKWPLDSHIQFYPCIYDMHSTIAEQSLFAKPILTTIWMALFLLSAFLGESGQNEWQSSKSSSIEIDRWESSRFGGPVSCRKLQHALADYMSRLFSVWNHK